MADFVRMHVPADEVEQHYFHWLCHIVRADVPANSYWELCRVLYEEPFVPRVANDDNRATDCEVLRDEFESLVAYPEYPFRAKPCRFLEMMIALAWRIQDSMCDPEDDRRVEWFWTMVDNLRLADLKDSRWKYMDGRDEVRKAVARVNDRTYSRNGDGGLFPLEYPMRDQRKVELWYQANAYLLEKEPMVD